MTGSKGRVEKNTRRQVYEHLEMRGGEENKKEDERREKEQEGRTRGKDMREKRREHSRRIA